MSEEGLVKPEQEPEGTRMAAKEAASISDGTLVRKERVESQIHLAGLIIFWILVIVGITLALVWAWHLGAPDRWRFLNTEQLSDLQKTLLAAVGSSAATAFSRKWVGDKSSQPS